MAPPISDIWSHRFEHSRLVVSDTAVFMLSRNGPPQRKEHCVMRQEPL